MGEQVRAINAEEIARIDALLGQIGGPNVVWGAKDRLDVWVAEARMESERRASVRLLVATWALVVATAGLVIATVGLIVTS